MIELLFDSICMLAVVNAPLDRYIKQDTFNSDFWEKRKEKAIRLIADSIKVNLKKPYHYFGYWDILRCARANTFMGDDTMDCVDEALKRLDLTEEFPKV